MKTLKEICSVAILALALTSSVHAGEISTPGTPSPSATPTPGVTCQAPCDMQTSEAPVTSPGDTGFTPELAVIVLALALFF